MIGASTVFALIKRCAADQLSKFVATSLTSGFGSSADVDLLGYTQNLARFIRAQRDMQD